MKTLLVFIVIAITVAVARRNSEKDTNRPKRA